MAESGLSISQTNGTAAYGRAEAMAAAIPVRPTDPTAPRFQPADPVTSDQAEGQSSQSSAATSTTEIESQANTSKRRKWSWGDGFGLLGGVTSFLARILGQTDGSAATGQSTTMKAGITAYNQAAGMNTPESADDILAMSFPRLASGRTLDLTV